MQICKKISHLLGCAIGLVLAWRNRATFETMSEHFSFGQDKQNPWSRTGLGQSLKYFPTLLRHIQRNIPPYKAHALVQACSHNAQGQNAQNQKSRTWPGHLNQHRVAGGEEPNSTENVKMRS